MDNTTVTSSVEGNNDIGALPRSDTRIHISVSWGWLIPAASFVAFMLIIEILLRSFSVPTAVIPLPSLVLQALISKWSLIWQHLKITIVEASIGFTGGSLAAVGTSLLFTLFQPIKRGILPLLIALQTVPIIVFAPILAMMMGNGMAPKIVVAGLICYFPTVINMVRGLNSPSPLLLDLFTVLNASRLQELFKLRLPSSMGYLFSSIRIATANCLIGALVAEWISADRGAGYLMVIKMYQLETPTLYATVVATSTTAILLFKLAEKVEGIVLPWASSNHQQ